MRSKLWAAQDALTTLLQAAPALSGVEVQCGTPLNPLDLKADNVFVASEIAEWTASYAVSGIAAKDESFVLRVNCLAIRLGSEYIAARDRAKALGEAVEDVIAANRTLSGNVEMAVIERAEIDDAMWDERRRGVQLRLFVRCRAWLNT